MKISDKQVAELRSETPSCSKVIHFNHAGASMMPDPVFGAVVRHLELERDTGGYEAAALAEDAMRSMYSGFAKLLRVMPEEIAFVENATRAWDMAFYALPLKAGDRIITHSSDYSSNYLAFLHLAKRSGIEIDIAPSDSSGQIDVTRLDALLQPSTKVINLTHVPTQGGLVNPAAEVGRFAREHGLTYFLDACQSVGQIDLDVTEIGCHVLSGTGRKFLRGPRGTGFLYVSNEILQDLNPPFIDMHAATWTDASNYELAAGARRFENWESYIAGRIGLGAAVEYALKIGLPAIEDRVTYLADRLRASLSEIDGVNVRDLGSSKCGIVTFEKEGQRATDLMHRLRENGVNISVIGPESAQLDFAERDINELARASVHYINTETEIERFCDFVAQ